jgi:hypothetical protein
MTFDMAGLMVGLLDAIGTIGIAYIVYRWAKKTENANATREAQNEWQQYNQLVLTNPDVAQVDRNLHQHGDISAEDHRKMFVYFMILNMGLNIWISKQNKLIRPDIAVSINKNISSLLHKDKDFIEQHVFPRGYPDLFAELLREHWQGIDAKVTSARVKDE